MSRTVIVARSQFRGEQVRRERNLSPRDVVIVTDDADRLRGYRRNEGDELVLEADTIPRSVVEELAMGRWFG